MHGGHASDENLIIDSLFLIKPELDSFLDSSKLQLNLQKEPISSKFTMQVLVIILSFVFIVIKNISSVKDKFIKKYLI